MSEAEVGSSVRHRASGYAKTYRPRATRTKRGAGPRTSDESTQPTESDETGKLAEVAGALDCTLVYALVPNTTLEQTVSTQAETAAARLLGYAARTMALEAQDVDPDRQSEAIERYAQKLVGSSDLWHEGRSRSKREK